MIGIRQLIAFLILSVYSVQSSNATEYKFSLIHFGDINGQLEIYERGTEPPKTYIHRGDQAGGLGSLVQALKKSQTEDPLHKVVRISTGNLVGGAWMSILGWKNYSEAVKTFYKPDFMGFGLNEFEAGLEQANTYLEDSGKTVIISNIRNDSQRDTLKNCKEFGTFDVENGTDKITIGVIGFVHPLVMNLSDPGNLIFDEIVKELKRVSELSAFSDVKSIIAIGSGDSDTAKQILERIPKVKLVMYSNVRTGEEEDEHKKYPESAGPGKHFAYSSSLKYGGSIGKLTFKVDSNGNFELVEGSGLIKIDASTGEDQAARNFFEGVHETLKLRNVFDTITRTLVKLDGRKEACWRSECNLGNLVTDAMVHCAINSNISLPVNELIGIVAIWHSGALFDGEVIPTGTQLGNITGIEIHNWFPYHNMAYLVPINGLGLKQMFTLSGQGLIANTDKKYKDWGQFLQISSGLEVSYSKIGEVLSLKTLHVNDSKPYLEEVKDNDIYQVIMPLFLFNGRNVYGFLKDYVNRKHTPIDSDDNCLSNYLKTAGVLRNGFENRILVDPPSNTCPVCRGSNTATTVVLTLVIFILIVITALGLWLLAWPRFQTWRRTSSYP